MRLQTTSTPLCLHTRIDVLTRGPAVPVVNDRFQTTTQNIELDFIFLIFDWNFTLNFDNFEQTC